MAKKKDASDVPAFTELPGALAPIKDWLEYRRGLDRLESELRPLYGTDAYTHIKRFFGLTFIDASCGWYIGVITTNANADVVHCLQTVVCGID